MYTKLSDFNKRLDSTVVTLNPWQIQSVRGFRGWAAVVTRQDDKIVVSIDVRGPHKKVTMPPELKQLFGNGKPRTISVVVEQLHINSPIYVGEIPLH